MIIDQNQLSPALILEYNQTQNSKHKQQKQPPTTIDQNGYC